MIYIKFTNFNKLVKILNIYISFKSNFKLNLLGKLKGITIEANSINVGNRTVFIKAVDIGL